MNINQALDRISLQAQKNPEIPMSLLRMNVYDWFLRQISLVNRRGNHSHSLSKEGKKHYHTFYCFIARLSQLVFSMAMDGQIARGVNLTHI